MYYNLRRPLKIILITFIAFPLLMCLDMTFFCFRLMPIFDRVASESFSIPINSKFASYENVTTNMGDIIVEGNSSYIIENCEFNQVGNVTVRENATLIIRNSIFNQTGDDRVGIMLYDKACFILNNSYLIISQDFDSNIYVHDESRLYITNSNIINCKFGICIWVEDYNIVYIQNSNMTGGSVGGIKRLCVIMAMNYTVVYVQNTRLDRIVCWNNATVFAQDCMIHESMKIYNNVKAYVSRSVVDYIWVSQNANVYFHSSTINASNPTEYAVRAIHQSNVWFKHSYVNGEVYAVNNSKIWLINTSLKKVTLLDNASIFIGWELPLFGELYVPHLMASIVNSTIIAIIVIASIFILVFIARKIILKRKFLASQQKNAETSLKKDIRSYLSSLRNAVNVK